MTRRASQASCIGTSSDSRLKCTLHESGEVTENVNESRVQPGAENFSWTEFLEYDSLTERVDSRGSVLSFCVHTRQQHNFVTVLSQSELHSWQHLFLSAH